MNVCHVYDSRRGGSYSRTTCSGSTIVTPWLCQTIDDPTFQSVSNIVFHHCSVKTGSVSICHSRSGVVRMYVR